MKRYNSVMVLVPKYSLYNLKNTPLFLYLPRNYAEKTYWLEWAMC